MCFRPRGARSGAMPERKLSTAQIYLKQAKFYHKVAQIPEKIRASFLFPPLLNGSSIRGIPGLESEEILKGPYHGKSSFFFVCLMNYIDTVKLLKHTTHSKYKTKTVNKQQN